MIPGGDCTCQSASALTRVSSPTSCTTTRSLTCPCRSMLRNSNQLPFHKDTEHPRRTGRSSSHKDGLRRSGNLDAVMPRPIQASNTDPVDAVGLGHRSEQERIAPRPEACVARSHQVRRATQSGDQVPAVTLLPWCPGTAGSGGRDSTSIPYSAVAPSTIRRVADPPDVLELNRVMAGAVTLG